MQNIAYKEFLPTVLGDDAMQKYYLTLEKDSKYDPDVDSSIRNEFSAAGFRFGHSLVQDVFEGKDQPWKLGNFYGDAKFAVGEKDAEGKGYQREMEGMCSQAMLAADRCITKELTTKLFNSVKMDNSSSAAGIF